MDRVDFREIAAKYSFREHAERADRYFATLGLDAAVARKPFANPLEAVEIASGVAAVLSNLALFHGANVLDFGAGTCWLSRIFALLGCEVTACDVSAHALALGRTLIQADPLADTLKVSFVVSEEPRLPFPDGAFDRVVVFDAFHHSPDQKSLIGEFHRVLKDNGIVAFHEPGPDHSKGDQSQYEMRSFDVIEGDIVVEDLIDEARRVGFAKAELAVYAATPAIVDVSGFQELMRHEDGGDAGRALVARARNESVNRRVFFLRKGGPVIAADSRSGAGLLAELRLAAELVEGGVRIHGQARNVGPTTWLPSVGGVVGSVFGGVHLAQPDGALLDMDYARIPVSRTAVRDGDVGTIDCVLPLPEGHRRFVLVLDLVAEGVSWFEIRGSRPVRVEVDLDAGRVATS